MNEKYVKGIVCTVKNNHWSQRGKCIVLFSGGLDSTVALYLAAKTLGTQNVLALNCFYGQKHKIEIQQAQEICETLGVKYRAFDLKEVYTNSCATLLQGRENIAQGTYAEQTEDARANYKNHLDTTIPFRNGVMLSVGAAIAQAEGYATVMYAAHKDDAGAMYADCSIEFYRAMCKAIEYGTGGEVIIAAPFIHTDKTFIVGMGVKLNVPFEKTWSCYDPREGSVRDMESDTAVCCVVPCGKCGTCLDRKKAFAENNIEDPLTFVCV